MAKRTAAVRRTSDWPDDAAVEAAAAWATAVHGAAGVRARLTTALGSRAGLAAAVAVARGLPTVPLPLGTGPEGTELAGWFGGTARFSPLDRAPVAVLELPGTTVEHLAGRPRQALRTNLTRARAAGLTCTAVPDDHRRRDVVALVAALRHQDPGAMVRDRDAADARPLTLVTRTATGEPVGLAEVLVDGRTAGLVTLVTAPDNPAVGALRYLLHAAVVEELIRAGVQLLVVSGSMLLTSAGTRYFQRRTGFVPARVRPVRAGQASSGSRAGMEAANPGCSGTPGSARDTQPTAVLSASSRR